MIEQETDPVIVVGDFNSTQHHWVYRHISRSLTDAHRAAGSGFGWTFPAHRPLVRIDHVLVSGAWAVVRTHVSSHHATSDHRPVVTRLRWRGTPRQ
jgi:vancomycin resistance protein VanJ